MLFHIYSNFKFWQLILGYCLFGFVVMFGSYFLLRKYFPSLVVPEDDADFMSALHAALFTITFLTLGYSLVNASDTVDHYQQDVVYEANQIKSLDLLFAMYDSKQVGVLREDLRNYAKSIVQDEWPLLEERKGSPVTLDLQRKLRSDLSLLTPTTLKDSAIYSEILQNISRIIQARSTRIANSDARIAPLFILANNVGYFCVLLISALMLTRFSWIRCISLTIQVIAVSFIFASTIALDNPFSGPDKIESESIGLVSQTLNVLPH
jgi:hypothetical protein